MAQAQSQLAAASETGPQEHLDDLAQPARKVVFVVEDEPTLLEVICFVLESEGFSVETAKNGKDALERLRTGLRPSIVLLDLMMPVMNGWEFLAEVAKIPSLEPPPIVVLTAGDQVEIPGAAGVLPKPYDLELLLEVVEHHTSGRGVDEREK
jgi:CheY-like chemotaxis protein